MMWLQYELVNNIFYNFFGHTFYLNTQVLDEGFQSWMDDWKARLDALSLGDVENRYNG